MNPSLSRATTLMTWVPSETLVQMKVNGALVVWPRNVLPAKNWTLVMVPLGSTAETVMVTLPGLGIVELLAGLVMLAMGVSLWPSVSSRSKLRSLLSTVDWWTSTPRMLTPSTRFVALTMFVRKAFSVLVLVEARVR